jgi:hypothetical protein
MAKYRLMSAVVVNIAGQSRLDAGSVVTEGKELPAGYIPGPALEPLDLDATNKFFAAGPWSEPVIDLFVAPPLTYFAGVPGTGSPDKRYALTGPLGVGFASKFGGS